MGLTELSLFADTRNTTIVVFVDAIIRLSRESSSNPCRTVAASGNEREPGADASAPLLSTSSASLVCLSTAFMLLIIGLLLWSPVQERSLTPWHWLMHDSPQEEEIPISPQSPVCQETERTGGTQEDPLVSHTGFDVALAGCILD